MSTTRVIGHSVRTMSRYKVRSAFMMLGSIVGVAALTLVVSAGEAAERKLIEMMGRMFGNSSILIVDGGGRFMGSAHGTGTRLKMDDIAALAREVRGIEAWDPQQGMPGGSARHGDATDQARVTGASERFEQVWGRKATRGECFDAAAVRTSARVALIGETVAKLLFKGEDPVGGEIRIGSVPFRVIGVLEAWGTDPHGMDRDNEVVVPISTLMRRVTNVDTIAAAKLLVRDPENIQKMRGQIERILRERRALAPNEPDDFSIVTPTEVQRMVGEVRKILFLYLPIVAGISLLVGALVAAILMLVSISERTGEIGLKRAVGAGTGDIRLQFLIETVSTTLAGGALGIAVGYAVAHMAATRMHLGDIDVWTPVLMGIITSILVGLAAGVFPAMRAARMHPADALR